MGWNASWIMTATLSELCLAQTHEAEKESSAGSPDIPNVPITWFPVIPHYSQHISTNKTSRPKNTCQTSVSDSNIGPFLLIEWGNNRSHASPSLDFRSNSVDDGLRAINILLFVLPSSICNKLLKNEMLREHKNTHGAGNLCPELSKLAESSVLVLVQITNSHKI